MRDLTGINENSDTREIVVEKGFAVVGLGESWYQMECRYCPAVSVRDRDWQKCQRWGHIHRNYYHKDKE